MLIRTIIIASALLFSITTRADEQTETLRPADPIGIEQVVMKSMPSAVQNLLQYALSYEGVTYRRGGTNPEKGFDCSGFVRHVFSHAEGVSLPHNANAISHVGDHVKVTELLPGDLVFFRIMRKSISHVGIYLGNNQFIHASSSRSGSVMVSSLNDSYWAKHFALSRRVDTPAVTTPNFSTFLPASPALRLDSSLPSFSSK